MTTAELRKSLKVLGFKLSISSSSLGRYATIKHIESGASIGDVCFDPNIWPPCRAFLDQNKDAILAWKDTEKVFGPKSWF